MTSSTDAGGAEAEVSPWVIGPSLRRRGVALGSTPVLRSRVPVFGRAAAVRLSVADSRPCGCLVQLSGPIVGAGRASVPRLGARQGFTRPFDGHLGLLLRLPDALGIRLLP